MTGWDPDSANHSLNSARRDPTEQLRDLVIDNLIGYTVSAEMPEALRGRRIKELERALQDCVRVQSVLKAAFAYNEDVQAQYAKSLAAWRKLTE